MESYENKEERVISNYTLNFFNDKIEREYSEKNRDKRRRDNLKINLFSFTFALGLLIVLFSQSGLTMQKLRTKNIQIEKITDQSFFSKNKTSLQKYVFNDYYILNLTLYENRNLMIYDCLVAFSDPEIFQLVREKGFFQGNFFNVGLVLICYSVCMVFCFFSSSKKTQIACFCLEMVMFGQTFHLVAGLLTVVFQLNTGAMFFLIALQLMMKVLITFYTNTSWVVFTIGSIISMILEWTVYLIILPGQSVILYYLTVNTLVHYVCIAISYLNLKKEKSEFYLRSKMNSERDFMLDLIYNMDQGYVTYSREILFINKSMAKIITLANQTSINQSETLIENEKRENETDTVYLSTKSLQKLNMTSHSKVKPFESNVKPGAKLAIEALIRTASDLNPSLPQKVYNFLSNKVEGILAENFLESFNEVVKGNQNFYCFTYLGSVTVETDDVNFPIKKYQIMFRVFDPYGYYRRSHIEFMFNDVSQIVENEKQRAVVNSRAMFLTKVAHEFKNPISSVIELSSLIKEEVQDNSHPDLTKITEHADYIDKVSKVMSNFLKDYTLFSNLKFSCVKGCSFNQCKKCSLDLYCDKCKLCKVCDECEVKSFELAPSITNLMTFFKSLSRHEKQNCPLIAFEDIVEVDSTIDLSKHTVIRSNKELLISAIYNLLFYSYKSTVTNNLILLKIVRQNLPHDVIETHFEIQNNSLQIDDNFIKSLESNKNLFYFVKNDSTKTQDDNEQYMKYMEIFIAYKILKKLNIILTINSTRETTSFSFKINNIGKDLIPVQRRLSSSKTIVRKPQVDSENVSNNETVLFGDRSMYIRYQSINNFVRYETNNSQDEKFLKFPTGNSAGSASHDGIKVLILDDEYLIRNTMKRHFKKIEASVENLKFCLHEASNCFDGLSILYQSYINNLKYDIIVTDESMPNMKGSTLIRLLKQLFRENNLYNVKIISHTAFDTSDKKQFILDAGADFMLSKPVEFEDFKDLILNIISLR